MPVVKNFGMLAAIDWNSYKWQQPSSQADLDHSNFGFVKEHNITYTSLNFGQELYPADADGYYWGLLPQLWGKSLNPESSRYVEVVFMKAKNWQDNNHYIVGLYAFPQFKTTTKPSPIAGVPGPFDVNVKALPKYIHLLENYINLNNNSSLKKFLPKGKELGARGFNYLTKENVFSILDTMTKLNPTDSKLSTIKLQLIRKIGV